MKCEPRRLKARGAEERGTRRLKARGRRMRYEAPEGQGEKERHALAKPRLVAVLRSKLRFTCFLQVPTGSHCLSSSPPCLQADLPYSAFPLSLFSAFPKCCLAHISFFLPLDFGLISRL